MWVAKLRQILSSIDSLVSRYECLYHTQNSAT